MVKDTANINSKFPGALHISISTRIPLMQRQPSVWSSKTTGAATIGPSAGRQRPLGKTARLHSHCELTASKVFF